MNQQRDEMLSALFDGQTSEFETRRVLSELSDAEVQTLRRYQLMRDACQKNVTAFHRKLDVTAAVAAAIAEEAAPKPVVAAAKTTRVKPFVAFAAAASVAFVAVLGVQQWRLTESAIEQGGFVADGNVSASQLPIATAPGLTAASGVSTLPAHRPNAMVDLAQEDKQELDEELQIPPVAAQQ